MKKWNVRYIFQSVRTGEITRRVIDLSTIELGAVPNLFQKEGLKVLFRDMGSGVLDIDGNEIFENDFVKSGSRNAGMPIHISFKEGQFAGEYGKIRFMLDQEFEQMQIIGDKHSVDKWIIGDKGDSIIIGQEKKE